LKYDTILFDFDGVLVDSEPIHYACWSDILADFGIALDWDFYARECIGVSDRLMIERLCGTIGFDRLWQEYPRKAAMFRERVTANPPFDKSTIDLVKRLNTYKLGVVSSSGRMEVEPPLEQAGIRPYFQALVCGREVENLKPAPDPYLKAAELLQAKKPIVIEDSDAGEESGRAAGFDVLRVSGPLDAVSRLSAMLKLS
jgi:beta-phosphoglucomutase